MNRSATTELASKDNDFTSSYEISDKGYGKDNVKILHVQREGALHKIKEFEVNTHLKLYSSKDYLHGNYYTFDPFYYTLRMDFIMVSVCVTMYHSSGHLQSAYDA